VQFYAFDILVRDARDLPQRHCRLRKTNLARLLARPRRRHTSAAIRRRATIAGLFRHACCWTEGLVSSTARDLSRRTIPALDQGGSITALARVQDRAENTVRYKVIQTDNDRLVRDCHG